ncbi:hypothetical protein CCUS01_15926 [Colletotrichum cuscutae]|uniref:Uncharacterized protein n=1 Tax=Colletotrichum cuscutae TaxID=1209917 RepID=A0AAI9VD66_9PEZI|nr:hypothetical protein CCUS01_15926 [Colletotrichum cuscutae]
MLALARNFSLLYSTRNSKHSALPAPVRRRRRRTGVRHVEKPVAQLDDSGIVPGVYVLGEQQPSRSPKDPPFPNSFFDFIRVTLEQQENPPPPVKISSNFHSLMLRVQNSSSKIKRPKAVETERAPIL